MPEVKFADIYPLCPYLPSKDQGTEPFAENKDHETQYTALRIAKHIQDACLVDVCATGSTAPK